MVGLEAYLGIELIDVPNSQVDLAVLESLTDEHPLLQAEVVRKQVHEGREMMATFIR